MTTVSQLIDQCSGMLHSYTGTVEATTFLTASLDASSIGIQVGHPQRLLQGIIEVGDELMWVSDQGSTSVTLFPTGRGVMNTTPAAHAINTRVTNDPLIPRQRIFEELQATVRQLHDLYQVKTTEITSSPVQTTYEVPAGVDKILKVQYEVIGASKEWLSVNGYHLDQNADTATGKALVIHQCIQSGRRVQITYAATLPVPAATTDDLETLGVPGELHDILRYGACWRTIQMMAPARMNLRTVEAQVDAQGVTPDSITNVAKQFFQMFALRRDEERKNLLDKYPMRKHYVKG